MNAVEPGSPVFFAFQTDASIFTSALPWFCSLLAVGVLLIPCILLLHAQMMQRSAFGLAGLATLVALALGLLTAVMTWYVSMIHVYLTEC